MDNNGSSSTEKVAMLADSQPSSPSPPPAPPLTTTHDRLQRLGSGESVVLDPPEAGGVEAESRKLPSSKFKGVVPQPNGRWGAQIYERHQRVWLGTFNEESEAAKAYDVAAQRFRGRDAVTNFKPLSEVDESDASELLFLNSHSKAEIVDMLRKHTYHDELQQSRRYYGSSLDRLAYGKRIGYFKNPMSASAREDLFDKAVTPSDVGKLNRLVIPKQHAEKHFPLDISTSGTTTATSSKGVLLNFEDAGGKVWRFRYSYWNSSQSYVFTKGWSRFVKEKSLKAGDVVSFQRSTGPEKQLFIDWKPRVVVTSNGSSGAVCYQPFLPVQPVRPVQVVRLFGVNIFKIPGGSGDGHEHDKKRRLELHLFPEQKEQHHQQQKLSCNKKQCIIGAS